MKKFYEHENISVSLSNIEFVKVTRNANFSFDLSEGREKNGFVFVENGAIEYTFIDKDGGESDKWTVGQGEVVFFPRGTKYTAKYLVDLTTITIAQFDLSEGRLPEVLSRPVIIPMYESERQIKRLFDQPMIAVSEEEKAFFLAAKTYEIIWNAISLLKKVSPKFIKLSPALREIRKNYMINEKIGYYAELCSMSESNFRLLFRGFTGKSPIEYRNGLRLSEARRLIDSGEYTVSEAAYLAGFRNMSFFYELYGRG
jgi:AraC-like DNA-binding protein